MNTFNRSSIVAFLLFAIRFIPGIQASAEIFAGDLAYQKQKSNNPDTASIYISESKFSLTNYDDSLLSISTIILYHRAKPFEGDYFYEVFINDSIVYDAVWGTADTIKVESQKTTSICAISVTGECLDIIPGRGKIFFISCGMKKGKIRGRPLLEFVEPAIAEKELKKISK
jgi:hypothetical protein